MLLEGVNSLRCRRHVGPFGDTNTAVGNQFGGIITVQLILRGARHRNVTLHAPGTFTGVVGCARITFGIFADAAAVDIFQFENVVQFFGVDSVRVVNVTRRIGCGHHFGTQLGHLLDGILSHIPRTRDGDYFTCRRVAACGEHLLSEVAHAVTRGFGTQRTAAPIKAFARQRTRKLVAQPFVLTEHKTDFPSTHANISGRYIGIGTDVPLQLGDETLAETHHFVVRFSFGVEVRAPFTAAHW